MIYLLSTYCEKQRDTVINKTDKALFSWGFHLIWEIDKDNNITKEY